MNIRARNLTLDIVKAKLNVACVIGLEDITEDLHGDIILNFKPLVFPHQLAALKWIFFDAGNYSIRIPKQYSKGVIEIILNTQKNVVNNILALQNDIPIEIIAALDDNYLFKMIKQSDKQFILGSHFLENEKIDRAEKRAIFWLQKAADQEYAIAQYFLGV